MIENPSHGLTLLDPDREVVVTREEHHQPALRRWAPHGDGRPRRVAVELRFVPNSREGHAGHAGQRGIEVRLDGQRVGELTFRMAQRYGLLVEDVLRRGGRPGCVALVRHGKRGIEVELRLPHIPSDTAAPTPSPGPPTRPGPAVPPARPGGSGRGNHGRGSRKPAWIGVVVAALLLVIIVSVGGRDDTVAASTRGTPDVMPTTAPAATSVAAVATSAAAVPTSTTTTATTTTATDVPVVAPAAVPAPTTVAPARQAPRPAPVPEPVAEPEPVAAPEPVAEPDDDCDPNYSGCVPIAGDVDCVGGSGNGPAYVSGPVRVTGSDVYDLDSNGDGEACE